MAHTDDAANIHTSYMTCFILVLCSLGLKYAQDDRRVFSLTGKYNLACPLYVIHISFYSIEIFQGMHGRAVCSAVEAIIRFLVRVFPSLQ